jgi:hypothetical protein
VIFAVGSMRVESSQALPDLPPEAEPLVSERHPSQVRSHPATELIELHQARAISKKGKIKVPECIGVLPDGLRKRD